MAAVVAAVGAIDVVADSVAAAAAPAAAAAAILESARANIAVQRYILDAACGIDIGMRQETHDFYSVSD